MDFRSFHACAEYFIDVSKNRMLSVFLSFTSKVNVHVCETIMVGGIYQLQVVISEHLAAKFSLMHDICRNNTVYAERLAA